MPAPFTMSHQPCTAQDIPSGARRRPGNFCLHTSQPSHQLLRSPRRMGLFGRDHSLGHCTRGPISMASRSSAPVSQSFPTIRPEPLDPLVAGLATYAELTAQLHERHFPSFPSFNESYLFLFWARLIPGQHTHLLMGCLPFSPNVLPMCPVYLLPMYQVCTYRVPSPGLLKHRASWSAKETCFFGSIGSSGCSLFSRSSKAALASSIFSSRCSRRASSSDTR